MVDWSLYLITLVKLFTRSPRNKDDLKPYTRNYITVTAIISILFGIAWIFGLVGTSSTEVTLHEVGQYIFAVFIALHSAFLFILHLIRSEEALDSWKRLWYSITCRSDQYTPKRTYSTARTREEEGRRHKDVELSYRAVTPGSTADESMPLSPTEVEPKTGGVVENVYVTTTTGSSEEGMVEKEEEGGKEKSPDDHDEEGVATRL